MDGASGTRSRIEQASNIDTSSSTGSISHTHKPANIHQLRRLSTTWAKLLTKHYIIDNHVWRTASSRRQAQGDPFRRKPFPRLNLHQDPSGSSRRYVVYIDPENL
jgi:hypothetical protein